MAGRKLSQKTFLKEYCKYITSSKDYRLSSFCENINWTALPIVFIYAHYFCDETYFLNNIPKDMKKYCLENKINCSFHNLSKHKNSEFSKVNYSYYQRLNESNADSNSKMLYKNILIDELSKTSIPKYKLCKMANVSPGNLSLFLKGDFSKISIEKCSSLINEIRKMN